ncbi:MAG: TIGR00730 family Rossman fold protein [bacterium]
MGNYTCKSITVYCSSSNHVDDVYLETARKLGQLIAQNDYTLVFGGGYVGLMGALSAGARERGGEVVGIILQKFLDMGVADPQVNKMQIVSDMRSRKQGLEEAGDAYIALPGGFGTLEELTEMISFKQLRFHNKPIIIINVKGYFDNLVEQFKLGVAESFVEKRFGSIYEVVTTPQQAITAIQNYRPPDLAGKSIEPLR